MITARLGGTQGRIPQMTNHPNRNRKPPFEIGQRVLFQNDQLKWTYTVAEIISGAARDGHLPDYRVRALCGISSLTANASRFIEAPDDWEDAPDRPQSLDGRFDGFDPAPGGWTLFASDSKEQQEINAWRAAFEAWDRRHRQPLLKRLASQAD